MQVLMSACDAIQEGLDCIHPVSASPVYHDRLQHPSFDERCELAVRYGEHPLHILRSHQLLLEIACHSLNLLCLDLLLSPPSSICGEDLFMDEIGYKRKNRKKGSLRAANWISEASVKRNVSLIRNEMRRNRSHGAGTAGNSMDCIKAFLEELDAGCRQLGQRLSKSNFQFQSSFRLAFSAIGFCNSSCFESHFRFQAILARAPLE